VRERAEERRRGRAGEGGRGRGGGRGKEREGGRGREGEGGRNVGEERERARERRDLEARGSGLLERAISVSVLIKAARAESVFFLFFLVLPEYTILGFINLWRRRRSYSRLLYLFTTCHLLL
jgi:hypothetical protein